MVAGRRYVYRIKARYGSTLSVTSDYVNVRVSRPPDVEVSFEESVYAINEGASATIRIILSADPKRTVVVEITRTNQGDAADEDLTGVPENVTFIPGDIEASFTLNADDDSEFRGNISVTLAFGTLPDRVSAGSNSQATISITDNDPGVSAKAINPPATHDGSASFRVKVRFSKPLRNSRTKVIKAFRDTTGAKVGGARRANTSATPGPAGLGNNAEAHRRRRHRYEAQDRGPCTAPGQVCSNDYKWVTSWSDVTINGPVGPRQ